MAAESASEQAAPWFFRGGGVMGELARATDWSKTALGSPSSWPESLKTTVATILNSRHPMFLWWGPELVQIYNDGYLPSFGRGKHPGALGQPGRECWPEIWPIIGPQIDDVMQRAKPCWHEDQLVPILRNGRLEEVYWTYGYSPVFASEDVVGGTLVVVTETTARVVAARRLGALPRIAECVLSAQNLSDVLKRAAEQLESATSDIPFALFYSENGGEPRLEAAASVRGEALAALDRCFRAWRGSQAEGPLPIVADGTAPHLPAGPWPETVTEVFVVPLRGSARGANGFAVFGLSPRLTFDAGYRDFLVQLVDHLSVSRERIEASRAIAATEHERNNLLLQAPMGTALLAGPEHVFTLANAHMCQMIGRDDVLGKSYTQAFPDSIDTTLPDLLDYVYRTGEPFTANEYAIVLDRDGKGHPERRFVRFSVQPMRDVAERVYGLMVVAVDITELVTARRVLEASQREREQLLSELERANRAKDEFLAMLGHELRNPLAPIVTALHLMKLRAGDNASRERAIIERQVTHLVRLVDDLLDVERITRGKIELRKATVELAEVIARAVEMASVLFEKRNHELVVSVPSGLRVDGDPDRLAQVFANLLTNAARYTNVGGHIELTAVSADERIRVTVHDNGMGIAAEMLPTVFDLFVQGKRAPDRSEGGLGLGLALVKSLVVLHGGTVSARSDGPGHGSEFAVELPASLPESSVTHARTPRAASAALALRRVLVVDDNTDAAEMLADMLRVAGHEVRVANDPVSALVALADFRPEIAVLDIGLPVMDGYELAERMRALPAGRECRLISLTGYGQAHDRARSLSAGFVAHLVKPVAADELFVALA